MGKIEQSYAWSESRVKCLRECRWKYYLTYQMAWEGWLSSATQEKQRAYMFKNMTNMPMFVGSVVHDTIENIIDNGRKTGNWASLEESQKDAIQRLRKGWKQSKDKRWQTSPKQNVNLEEHYYQIALEKDVLDGYKNKVLKSIKAFYDMPMFSVMVNLDKDQWLTLEDFQKFELKTGAEVTVKRDCGFKHDGKVWLLDWKTGRVSESVIDQLVTYAMYALKQGWAKSPEDVTIVPVYLAAYSELGEQSMPHLSVDMKHIVRQAGIINSEYPMLKEAFDNKDNPAFFPRTDNESACNRCFFRGMCPGALTEVPDDETPF